MIGRSEPPIWNNCWRYSWTDFGPRDCIDYEEYVWKRTDHCHNLCFVRGVEHNLLHRLGTKQIVDLLCPQIRSIDCAHFYYYGDPNDVIIRYMRVVAWEPSCVDVVAQVNVHWVEVSWSRPCLISQENGKLLELAALSHCQSERCRCATRIIVGRSSSYLEGIGSNFGCREAVESEGESAWVKGYIAWEREKGAIAILSLVDEHSVCAGRSHSESWHDIGDSWVSKIVDLIYQSWCSDSHTSWRHECTKLIVDRTSVWDSWRGVDVFSWISIIRISDVLWGWNICPTVGIRDCIPSLESKRFGQNTRYPSCQRNGCSAC